MLNRLWLATERCTLFNLVRLFRIRRQSEEVARGFAVGVMVHFFPTFGFGIVLAAFLAKLVRGSLAAGLVSGTLFTFSWPVLFYLNVVTGGLFVGPVIQVRGADDLTERNTVLWGKAFTVGAILNSLLAGLLVYLAFKLLYEQFRPTALAYFRGHAREHQKRFRRPRGELREA